MKRGDSLIQKVSPDIEDGNIRSEDLKKKKYASLQADKNYDRGMAYAQEEEEKIPQLGPSDI